MRLLKISLLFILILVSFIACENGNQSEVTMIPSDPRGSVGGVVFDGTTDQPMANVTISVIVGDVVESTTTDVDGVFSIENLPATGEVLVIYEADNYLSARQLVTFSQSMGETPYAHPTATASPVWLLQATRNFSFRLLDNQGRPLAQVPILLTMDDSFLVMDSEGEPDGRGSITRTADTNVDGIADFQGLPAAGQIGHEFFNSITIKVPDIDLDGDGYSEYNNETLIYSLSGNSGTVESHSLSEEISSNLTAVASNNIYFTTTVNVPGTFAAGDTMYVQFNRTISEENLEVTLYDSQGDSSQSLTTQAVVDGNLLEFDLPDDIAAGEKYYIYVYAITPDGGSFYQRAAPLFTTPSNAVTIESIVREDPIDPSSRLVVTFNQYIGWGSSITTATGTNGCIYMDFNYDGSAGGIGDASGESGFDTTHITFRLDEQLPYWLAGYNSGYLSFSKVFYIEDWTGPAASTVINFHFDNAYNSAYRIRTPSGALVPNLASVVP